MKRALIGIVAAVSVAAQAQYFTPIMLPTAPDSRAATNTPWWTITPLPTSTESWQLIQALNENLKRLSNALNNLPDLSTNGVVNSKKISTYTMSSLTVPHGGWVNLWVVTNISGIDWTVLQGVPMLYFSTDGGSNWSSCSTSLQTNVTVWLKITTHTNIPALDVPIDAVVTNITVYTLERPDKFGTVNATYGQDFRGDEPRTRDSFATRGYVDRLWEQDRSWSVTDDVQVKGHAVNWDPAWQTRADSSDPNYDRLHSSYLGVDAFTAAQPKATRANTVSIARDETRTKLVLSVATNGLFDPPRVQMSRSLAPAVWSWMTNAPTVTGTNYVFTFPMPWTDTGFFIAVVPSQAPGIFTLAGLLELPITVIYSNTASTYGLGSGLVAFDGTNLLVSVGTNSWAKWAPTATTWP